MLLPISGCSQKDSYGMVEIHDESIIENTAGYCFRANLFGHTGQLTPPGLLWNGMDDPFFKKKESYNDYSFKTYMIHYGEVEKDYYLVYLDDDCLAHPSIEGIYSEEKVKECLPIGPLSGIFACPFLSEVDKRVVDGKYLAIHNTFESRRDDLAVFAASSLEKVPLCRDNKTLVFAAKRQKMSVISDLNEGKRVDHSFYFYNRVALCFDQSEVNPTPLAINRIDLGFPYEYGPCSFSLSEGMFGLSGDMVVATPVQLPQIEGIGLYDLPYFGQYRLVYALNGVETITLRTGDRVGAAKEELRDYLDDQIDPAYDYYGEYKAFLRSAAVYETYHDDRVRYSYFRLDAIKELIAKCSNK